MTESTYTEIVDQAPPTPASRKTSGRLRPHTARVVAEAGRALLVWLAVAVVCSSQAPLTDRAIAAVTIAAAVWLVCLKATSSPDVLLFGRVLAHASGTLLGLVGAVLLNGSSIGLQLSPLALAGAAFGVLATTAVWDTFADLVLVARRRVLFVGTDAHDVMLPEDLGRCRQLGFEIVGAAAPAPGAARPAAFAGMDELERVVEAQQPDILVLADEATFEGALERLLDGRMHIRVANLAGFCEYALGRVPIEHIGPTWFMSLVHLRQRVYSRRSKRVFDIVASLVGIVLAAPVLLVLAVLAKTTPGPVFHRQVRVGEGGRNFTVLKFRTMRCDAERSGPEFACKDDPRITRAGRVLRKTHLDELPQLWNVFKGEMSMVGPRPERPEFIDMIEDTVPFWNRRVLVKPGITGWAQLLGDYASDHDGMTRKLSYDLWYLRHGSLLVDLAICLETFGLMLRSLIPGHVERGMGR
jgi:exopolysaccharide biosynthesis polyprenyl glycosylphosphotransferase